MENKTPKYANWVPEAGGYVADGKVVSKSPVYENGKLKVDVDTSVFSKAQPQVANVATTNNGITTANTAGSKVDVNAPLTEAGSLASMTTNTAKTGSAISTPAVDSMIAKYTPEDVLSQVNQKYLDAAARGDYKAMIEALTETSNIDGVDRTATINNLWKARGEKIRTQDDKYLNLRQQLKQAMNAVQADQTLTKEEKQAKLAELEAQDEQLANEQQAYRDMVGYDDQMSRDIKSSQESLVLEYQSAYDTAINDITGALIQALPGILNFQYDPYSDPALQIAQGYAVNRVKETMNSTGMYYSSMTQSAITKAVAELVPVYEKMAREEAIQNFNLLQQTATYLMNLEKHQFDMWEAQIQLKWEEAEQKQKQIDNAINNANARGYYTNEEAIIVGVPAGTESYEARKEAEQVQRDIAKEQRKLEQDKALAEFNKDMNIEYLKEQYNQMRQYYDYQRLHPATSGGSGGNGGSGSGTVTVKTIGENGEEIELKMSYDDAVRQGYIKPQGNTPYRDENGNIYEVSGKDFTSNFMTDGKLDMKKAESFIKNDIKNLSQAEQSTALSQAYNAIVTETIKENATKYGDSYSGTTGAVKDSFNALKNFTKWVQDSEIGDEKAIRRVLVGTEITDPTTGEITRTPGLLHNGMNQIINSIEKADTFDSTWGDLPFQGTKETQTTNSKSNAKKDLYTFMIKSGNSLLSDKLATDYAYLQQATQPTDNSPTKERVYVDAKDVKWGTGTGYYLNDAETQEALRNGRTPKYKSVQKAKDGRYYYTK